VTFVVDFDPPQIIGLNELFVNPTNEFIINAEDLFALPNEASEK
jgi:hypothetical protein